MTEDTIEEKVVERAQQKLKLDAMVVQQGRLADKDKMSKDDLLEALRFGADKVFRSKTTEITDEDIDAILESGRQRTEAMNEKLQQAEKGDMLDFKLDGGMATQQFDGIDYSTKEARDAVRDGGGGLLIDPTLAFLNMEDSKRERKAVSTYSENQRFALSDAPRAKKKPSKLPVHLRLPHRIEAWHLMKRERLYEISAQEESLYALTKPEDLPDDEREIAVLPEDLAREKNEIIANGFHSWSRLDYKNFIHGCNLHGRAASVEIAAHMAKNGSSKKVEEVAKYAHAYWETPLGEQSVPPAEWERNMRNLEKGDRRREEVQKRDRLASRARARARSTLLSSRLRPLYRRSSRSARRPNSSVGSKTPGKISPSTMRTSRARAPTRRRRTASSMRTKIASSSTACTSSARTTGRKSSTPCACPNASVSITSCSRARRTTSRGGTTRSSK